MIVVFLSFEFIHQGLWYLTVVSLKLWLQLCCPGSPLMAQHSVCYVQYTLRHRAGFWHRLGSVSEWKTDNTVQKTWLRLLVDTADEYPLIKLLGITLGMTNHRPSHKLYPLIEVLSSVIYWAGSIYNLYIMHLLFYKRFARLLSSCNTNFYKSLYRYQEDNCNGYKTRFYPHIYKEVIF